MSLNPLSSCIEIDDVNDLVRINGARVSGELFRHLAQPSPAGVWFRIVSVNETITIEQRREEVA